VLTCGIEVTSGWAWWSRAAGAAGGSAPANRRSGLDNKRVWELWWCKRKVGASRVGGDDSRRVELAVGANGDDNRGEAALHRARKDGDDPFIEERELEMW
jgi:hypothetical protein